MAALFNQFSFLFGSVLLGLILAFAMWRLNRPAKLGIRAVILLVYGAAAFFFVMSLDFPENNTPATSMEMIEQTLDNGQPTFVMLYSHFCIGCIAALPAVRDLGDDLEAEGRPINLLFIDIHSDVGSGARQRFGLEYTPTYLLYDAAGSEIMRQNGTPSAADIRELLQS